MHRRSLVLAFLGCLMVSTTSVAERDWENPAVFGIGKERYRRPRARHLRLIRHWPRGAGFNEVAARSAHTKRGQPSERPTMNFPWPEPRKGKKRKRCQFYCM